LLYEGRVAEGLLASTVLVCVVELFETSCIDLDAVPEGAVLPVTDEEGTVLLVRVELGLEDI